MPVKRISITNNITFNELYNKVRPELDNNGRKFLCVKRESDKNVIYAKKNGLALFPSEKKTEKLIKRSSDAALAVRNAIDREYPHINSGGKTLGEYIIKTSFLNEKEQHIDLETLETIKKRVDLKVKKNTKMHRPAPGNKNTKDPKAIFNGEKGVLYPDNRMDRNDITGNPDRYGPPYEKPAQKLFIYGDMISAGKPANPEKAEKLAAELNAAIENKDAKPVKEENILKLRYSLSVLKDTKLQETPDMSKMRTAVMRRASEVADNGQDTFEKFRNNRNEFSEILRRQNREDMKRIFAGDKDAMVLVEKIFRNNGGQKQGGLDLHDVLAERLLVSLDLEYISRTITGDEAEKQIDYLRDRADRKSMPDSLHAS